MYLVLSPRSLKKNRDNLIKVFEEIYGPIELKQKDFEQGDIF
jgi:hypothetical protein